MSRTVLIIRCSTGRGESKSAIVLRVLWPLAALVFIVCAVVAKASGIGPVEGGSLPQPMPIFPANNWWNFDISTAPVDPGSAAYIAFINNGGTRHLHPDMGGNVSPGSVDTYGIPYVVVDGTQPKVSVQFQYADESDGVNHGTGQSIPFYPIPTQAIGQMHWIECGEPGTVDQRNDCDRHLLIVDRGNKFLYELYNVWYDGAAWHAGSGAFFDMNASNRRPDGWTSADAAGLAILPGLLRYDEVYNAYGPNQCRRHQACVARHRAHEQWLRLSGIAQGGVHQRRIADGRTPAVEGQQEYFGIHSGNAESIPCDENLRADRGG